MSNMLKEREQIILDAVIREYIRTAKPVASSDIANVIEVEISPATIRGEMLRLDELGYLDQPHTSAGRVPTDRGYRYYVDYLAADDTLTDRERIEIEAVFEIDQEEEFARALCHATAHISQTFATAGLFEDATRYSKRFTEVFDEPEFADTAYTRHFARLVDLLDTELHAIVGAFEDRPASDDTLQVFIGKENPLKDAEHYAMMISSWRHPEGFHGFLALIGPKRTNYAKHKSLAHLINTITH